MPIRSKDLMSPGCEKRRYDDPTDGASGASCQRSSAESASIADLSARKPDRITFPCIDEHGVQMTVETTFDEQGNPRDFQSVDPWEIRGHSIKPSQEMEQHARLLRDVLAKLAIANGNHDRSLDDEIAFEAIETPEVCCSGLERLDEAGMLAVLAHDADMFNLPSHLAELKAVGVDLIAEFLDVKRRIRAWRTKVDAAHESALAFDERR